MRSILSVLWSRTKGRRSALSRALLLAALLLPPLRGAAPLPLSCCQAWGEEGRRKNSLVSSCRSGARLGQERASSGGTAEGKGMRPSSDQLQGLGRVRGAGWGLLCVCEVHACGGWCCSG